MCINHPLSHFSLQHMFAPKEEKEKCKSGQIMSMQRKGMNFIIIHQSRAHMDIGYFGSTNQGLGSYLVGVLVRRHPENFSL